MNEVTPKLTNTLNAMEKILSHKYGLANFASTSDLRGLIRSTDIDTYMIGGVIPMHASSVINATMKETNGAGGVSLNRAKSRIKAFGEFIERFCSIYAEDEHIESMLFDSFDDLTAKGFHCLNPAEIIPYPDCLYTDSRFPCAPYHTKQRISWIKGVNLFDKKEVWLPAQKVFLDFPYPKEELRYIYGLSTGLACGSCFHQASLGAIYEVIERDSLMLTWLLKIPGIRIEMDNIRNKELTALYNHINKHLVGEDRLHIYDISKTDGVYTALTFIRNDLPSAYGLIVSTASHANPEMALFKSLEELAQSQSFGYHHLIGDEERKCQHMDKDEIDTLHKHFFYYSTGKHCLNIDFIASSGEVARLSEMKDYSNSTDKEGFEYIVNLFCDKEQSVYIADITKQEFRLSRFSVLKAIIPGYIDLNPLHHDFRFQKGERLSKFQEEYGMELNDEPHPFP